MLTTDAELVAIRASARAVGPKGTLVERLNQIRVLQVEAVLVVGALLAPGHKLGEGVPLFPKVEDASRKP